MPGGKGEPTDTLGGITGWLITKGAPKEAADFLKFFISKDVQTRLAAGNFIVPVVKGARGRPQQRLHEADRGQSGEVELSSELL